MAPWFGSRPERSLEDLEWLRAFARRLVADEHDAEDLGQDVLAVASSSPPERGVDRSWLAAVARNLAVSMWRRRELDARSVRRVAPGDPPPSPDQLVAEAELQQRAVTAVLALPSPYRETVLMRFLRGMSLADVAAATGVPVETVRTRQRRAIAMLRAELQPPRRRGGLFLLGWWGLRSGGMALMMNKAVGVVVVVAVLAAAWWVGSGSPEGGIPPAVGEPVDPAPVVGLVPDRAEEATARELDRAAVEPVADPAAVVDQNSTLLVQVTWEGDGSPAVGYPVALRWPAQPVGRRARTDAEGRAVFAGLEAGDYVLRMLHGNVYRKRSLVAGREALESIALPRGHRMIGVVVGPGGAPVPGAELVANQGGTDPQWLYPIGVADAAGRFVVEGIGSLDLIGARDPRLGASDLVFVRPELRGDAAPRELRLVLPGDVAGLRGRVVDEGGDAIAGAWVRVGDYRGFRRDDSGSSLQQPPGGIRGSAADGSFEFAMLRSGEQRLRIYRRGFAPYDAGIELLAGRTRDLAIVLPAGGFLAGMVRDADGNPVAGAEIELDGGWYPAPTHATTAADGSFELDDLPVGRECGFTVTAGGFAEVQRSRSFVPGERVTWDLELSRGRSLRGLLVDERGEPLVGWFVGSDRHQRRAKTKDDGRFVFPDCELEAHRLVVRETFGFEPIVTTFADLWPRDGEHRLVVPDRAMPSARVRGRCLTAGGEPLAGITVDLGQGGWPVLPGRKVVRTDARGVFETPLLPPGSYRLRPAHAECVFDEKEIELRAGETLDLGDLRAAGR